MRFFHCPKCLHPTGLSILRRLEIGSDSRSDEISLQLLTCHECSFRALGVYEESRRGALDRESWSHTGYGLTKTTFRTLKRDLNACPQPGSPRCDCTTHRLYGRQDSHGRWMGTDGIELGEKFEITIF